MDNSTIKIPLSKKGKYAGKYVAVVSPEDAILADLNWNVFISKTTQYATRLHRKQFLHREVLARKLGRSLLPSEFVDHIDGDGLNNTRPNLRLATKAQNSANQGMKSNNTSGYKGVSWNKRVGKWAAQIMAKGKQNHLGYFETPELAYEAYCEAAPIYHQDFSRTESK